MRTSKKLQTRERGALLPKSSLYRRLFCLTIMLLFTLLNTGCRKPPQIQTMTGFAQGTVWNITIWDDNQVDLDMLRLAVDLEFNRIDQLLSGYRQDSVIEQFNSARTTEPMEVGAEIVSLLQTAAEVSKYSRGSYDPTIRALFELWGFKGKNLTPPNEQELAETMRKTGIAKLEVLPPDRLRKKEETISVDLSSIAQGYSVSRLAMIVEKAGIDNYIVEIGGELQSRGHKPDGSFWRIGLERPVAEERSLHKVLTIKSEMPTSVMTSGTYRRYFDEQGRRYSHILDARTGRPVRHDTVSVTVIHNDPTIADAWSTALLCLGVEEGAGIADATGIAALFITARHDQLEEHLSAAWRTANKFTME